MPRRIKGGNDSKPGKFQEFVERLNALFESAPPNTGLILSTSEARKLRETLQKVTTRLEFLLADLDPIKNPQTVFDPSNPNVVGRLVGITMIAQPRKPLATADRFYGSGVYALYYRGDFSPYSMISERDHPIYIGKADPADPAGKTAVKQGERLANRLNDHRRNIEKATSTLRLVDFEYRALVVQTGWQDAAEDYLIHLFRPIWNNEVGICYGFGKHGDDPKTRANLRSPWDTLHPGREWAHRGESIKDAKPLNDIVQEIAAHLQANPPFRTVDEILRRFIEEMRTMS